MTELKPITGSWLDFHHPNRHDGDYWNAKTERFTAQHWAEKVAEMAAIGMDTLVVLSVTLGKRGFYPSRVLPGRWPLAAEDPIEAVLEAADRLGVRTFLGVGFFKDDTGSVRADADEVRYRQEVPAELFDRYGRHASFGGWYLPVEAPIRGHFPDEYITYTRELGRICRAAAPKLPVLIAPYGTRTVIPDDRFVEQLKELEVDYVAYQDEVGVAKTEVEELPEIFARLADAHERARLPLWADMEVFRFEGAVYDSALLPAPWSRVHAQLASISPHVEKVLCYQYLGLMEPPNGRAAVGHPKALELYRDYQAWRTT